VTRLTYPHSYYPCSSKCAASPWDHISPSPTPVRASGSSKGSSYSSSSGKSHQLTFSNVSHNSSQVTVFIGSSKSDYFFFLNSLSLWPITVTLLLFQDAEADRSPSAADRNYEITEEMMQEMDYNADRAWYLSL
jgi:pre-mRNA-splicing factor ATP-dependent RNA helicase DHX38/PRP16